MIIEGDDLKVPAIYRRKALRHSFTTEPPAPIPTQHAPGWFHVWISLCGVVIFGSSLYIAHVYSEFRVAARCYASGSFTFDSVTYRCTPVPPTRAKEVPLT